MRRYVRIPLRHLITFGLILLLVFSLSLYFGITDPKIAALIGGISGGIAVLIISFLLSIYEYKQIDRFRALGILEVLSDRRNPVYYKDIVKDAKDIVQVMGTSCTRFIDDFANTESDNHVLIDTLNYNNNLIVQFLVPSVEHMDEDSKLKFQGGERKILALLGLFPGRVQLKRYDWQPRHSLVRVDSDLIVGPVFQEVESKNSPAIHLDTASAYAEKYLMYYSWAWEKGRSFP